MERLFRVSYRGREQYVTERDGVVFATTGEVFGDRGLGDPIPGGLAAAGLRVLAPVKPSKIVCVGLNYRNHALETGKRLPDEPLIFIKPPTAVIGPGDAITVPPGVGRVDHEGELGVVIGRRAHRVRREEAWRYILGLTCVNDITARDLQTKDVQYTRSKGFDTFAPIGPCVATDVDGRPRAVECWVNGQRRQGSSTSELIFPIDRLVEFITFVMTLEPGDIISTGTPEGISPIKNGDVVVVNVEGVGELMNPVEDEH